MNKRTSFLCGAVLVCLLGMGLGIKGRLECGSLSASGYLVAGAGDKTVMISGDGILFGGPFNNQPCYALKIDNGGMLTLFDCDGKVLQSWGPGE